ncbi:L-serine ammonia-lyase, iron-sulfur-dependent, subunit alpha [Herbiconiux solani]|uniref:L-serine ammonia-lyase, iron-sulfur-dependent, subunit alpha n=1 Tax=Herbiconiux solani TaxID=661329 RepID=UPI0008245D76|nr:L-serine ammonia-lyase, iron-sulfur-dependent, subunit alpha [Herbiconiux solani]
MESSPRAPAERIAGVFELFSIGIGPSSSHTVGPMRAAREFALECAARWPGRAPDALEVDVYGSLAATGRGHNTFGAVLLGLEGADPETVDPEAGRMRVAAIAEGSPLRLAGAETAGILFAENDIAKHPLVVRDRYANEVAFAARFGDETLAVSYYSIGGGFILRAPVTAAGAGSGSGEKIPEQPVPTAIPTAVSGVTEVSAVPGGSEVSEVSGASEGSAVPAISAGADARVWQTPATESRATVVAGGDFGSGDELLALCTRRGMSIAEVVLANEAARHQGGVEGVREGLHRIWGVMRGCIESGLRTEGILPGGLKVPRRAAKLARMLAEDGVANSPEWATIAAMAVNEENAAGNRVVTAPTNGAAGIVPAVLYHALRHRHAAAPTRTVLTPPAPTDLARADLARDPFDSPEARRDIETYLLTAAAIGGIIKQRASISGADVGCQGEVGSASAMAAAGLAALLGADVRQVENAAEVAMEHHLGLTCDPIGGLVQIPCIERNGVAAVTAITAAKLALGGDGAHRVSFDQVVETMRQTGADMSDKYRETARGGLAVNVPEC